MGRGRPRKTDPDIVLDTAMKVFWEKGYDGTSMSDLVTATGMAKPGLYACFGDKEALYKKALTNYINTLSSHLLEDLRHSKDPLKTVVRRFFDNVVQSMLDKNNPCGCFVVNSLIGCASQPPALEKLVRDFDTTRRNAFVLRFEQAQTAGELPADVNAKALGEFFSGQSLALGVLGRASTDKEAFADFIDVAMTAFPE